MKFMKSGDRVQGTNRTRMRALGEGRGAAGYGGRGEESRVTGDGSGE